MSNCIVVYKEDVYNKIVGDLTTKFPNARLNSSGQLIIPKDIDISNTFAMSRIIADQNQAFNSEKFGLVVSSFEGDYHYALDINPSEALVNDMTNKNAERYLREDEYHNVYDIRDLEEGDERYYASRRKTPVSERIEELKLESKKVKLTPDKTHYIIDGDLRLRQSIFADTLSEVTTVENDNMIMGATIGNFIDNLARDVLGGHKAKNKKTYYDKDSKFKTEVPDAVFNKLVKEMKVVKVQLENSGYQIITDDIVLHDTFPSLVGELGARGIAGTIDMMAYNPKTKDLAIVDFKNIKFDEIQYITRNIYNGGKTRDGRIIPARIDGWTTQLSLYSEMANSEQMGLPVTSLHILPISTKYTLENETLTLTEETDITGNKIKLTGLNKNDLVPGKTIKIFKDNTISEVYENYKESKSSKKRKSKRPITDNFEDYKRYLDARLYEANKARKEVEYDSRNNLISPEESAKKRTAIQKEIILLEKQRKDLKENSVVALFNSISNELDYLENMIKQADHAEYENLKPRLFLIKELLRGDGTGGKNLMLNYKNAGYGNLEIKLTKVEDTFNDFFTRTSDQAIMDSNIWQNLINSGIKEPNLEEYLLTNKDIGIFSQYFLGVTTSMENDTIIPSVMYSILSDSISKFQQIRKDLFEELEIASKEVKNKDYIFEKYGDGSKTGFLINVFNPNWNKKFLSSFYGSVTNFKKNTTARNYKKINDFLKEEAELIDPRKLRFFKEKYGTITEDSYFSESQKFKFSDEEMSAYETRLRDKLGPLYDEYINRLDRTLQDFQISKVHSLETMEEGNSSLNYQNIWEYIESFDDPKSFNLIEGEQFTSFNSLVLIPRGDEHYSDGFRNMNKEETDYYMIVRKIAQFIEGTYSEENYGRVAYPKIEKDLSQRLAQLKDDSSMLAPLFINTLNTAKGAFYEKGKFKNKETLSRVNPNYTDATKHEIARFKRKFMIEGMSQEDAEKQATNLVLSDYSEDLTRDIKAVTDLAIMHRSRQEVLPTIELLKSRFKSIKAIKKNGKEEITRKHAIARLETWVTREIYNEVNHVRGDESSPLGKNINKSLAGRAFASLSNTNYLNKFLHRSGDKYLTSTEDRYYRSLDEILDNKENLLEPVLGDFKYIKQPNGDFNVHNLSDNKKIGKVSSSEFFSMLEKHVVEEQEKLGLDSSLSGTVNGILGIIVFKGLALNPISGMFNRSEGKHTSMIMDQTGYYWTRGNLAVADRVLTGLNMAMMAGKMDPLHSKQRQKDYETFNRFLETMSILQDRKNELQRHAEDSDFGKKSRIADTDLFYLAVTAPERKNQGAVVLSVLMDFKIPHPVTGVMTPIFDRDKQTFNTHEVVDGKLQLREEFTQGEVGQENKAKYENIGSREMSMLKQKLVTTVSRIQGNYDPLDVIAATNHIWGKVSTIFMKWVFEHFMQRFAPGDGLNFMMAKKQLEGRYLTTLRRPGAAIVTFPALLGVMFGFGPLFFAGMGAATIVSTIYLTRLYSKQDRKQGIFSGLDTIQMMIQTVVSTLNYPLRVTNIAPEFLNYNAFETRKDLTEEEIGNLSAMAREVSIVLGMLAIKYAAALLLFHDDDDKDDERRMFYNFTQNQINRSIITIAGWADPKAFVDDHSRVAFLAHLQDTYEVLSYALDYENDGRLGKKLLDITPLPRILPKILTGERPYLDEHYYSDFEARESRLVPLRWLDTIVKDNATEGDYTAGREYRKLRKDYREEVRKELRAEGLRRKELKEEVDRKVDERFGRKPRGVETKDYLKEIE